MKNRKYILMLFLILVFTACTNTKNKIAKSENFKTEETEVKVFTFDKQFGADNDPWEGFNRRIYYFNYNADKYVLLPLVKTYKFVTPVFVQEGVTNFFRNIKGINTTANSLAQFKGRKAMRAIARFAINTVFGIGGIFDVASKMGMPKPYEDFGLTLAHYGVPRGPYLILPFLGPSYLRDAVGMGMENVTTRAADPYKNMKLFEINSLEGTLLGGIDKRKNIKFEYYGTNSPFEYEYIRFLWSKYRTLQEETGVEFF